MFCPRSMKAAFLRQLEDDVFLYCEENTGADTAALNARFGAPDDVASEFLGALDPMTFSRTYRSKQRILIAAAALVLAAAAIFGSHALREYITAQKLAADNSIELVPYEGELPEASGPGYWVRTNDGEDINYWVFDYDLNEWVNVPVPSE